MFTLSSCLMASLPAPGPRCFTMMDGSRRDALSTIMDLSDVILMTEVGAGCDGWTGGGGGDRGTEGAGARLGGGGRDAIENLE